jgi:four helix bundle protein
MPKIENSKPRTTWKKEHFNLQKCQIIYKKLPKTIYAIEDGKQAIKASGSVGANYIEANEALSKKDF